MSELEPTLTYSNPTATDELLVTGYPNSLRPELHKALKTRGIDYWVAQGITFWNRDDGCECLAYGYTANGVPKLAIKVVGFTDPEQAIDATLGSCNRSSNCTNSERTETCQADETDLIPFVRADSSDFEVDYIHVMECTECGHVYEHVNGDYEFCPRCGRKRRDVEE